MFKWLKDAFRFDGIQDDEIPEDSDFQWLTPMERIGVQSRADADIASSLIRQRKASYVDVAHFKNSEEAND